MHWAAWHSHGAGAGHRIAPCTRPAGVYEGEGYNLARADMDLGALDRLISSVPAIHRGPMLDELDRMEHASH
jgi:hypothetical protein